MNIKCKKYRFNILNINKIQLKYKFFAFFLILFIIMFLYIKYLAMPVIVSNTETQIKSYATKSINYAISETLNQNVSYGELINIVKDSSQNVSYIEANSLRINLLSKLMSREVISNFLKFAKLPITIALGSFSGISIFAGYGPKIAYSVNPHGEANSYFNSSFDSAGINQTNHKLYLVTTLKVYVVLPFKKLEITSSADVLLCETLIVGKIPEVYLSSGNLTEMLNLVPDRFTSWQNHAFDS